MSSELWRTPPEVLLRVARKFHIVHDVCASGAQICQSHWAKNALKKNWYQKYSQLFEEQCSGIFENRYHQAFDEKQAGKTRVFWMNPPWRRANKAKGITGISITPWLHKAATCGVPVLALLPIDTSTQNFHEFIYPQVNKGNVEFLCSRVRYLDGVTGQRIGSPKFASALVLFNAPFSPKDEAK